MGLKITTLKKGILMNTNPGIVLALISGATAIFALYPYADALGTGMARARSWKMTVTALVVAAAFLAGALAI